MESGLAEQGARPDLTLSCPDGDRERAVVDFRNPTFFSHIP
jgi:hypothetical protein